MFRLGQPGLHWRGLISHQKDDWLIAMWMGEGKGARHKVSHESWLCGILLPAPREEHGAAITSPKTSPLSVPKLGFATFLFKSLICLIYLSKITTTFFDTLKGVQFNLKDCIFR